MNEFRLGGGLSERTVGCCDGGTIYDGCGLGRRLVGSYRYDAVYAWDGHRDIRLGSYGGGEVRREADGQSHLIGSYDASGTVYRGVGLSRVPIGSYTGDEANAAALLLLFDPGRAAPAPSPVSVGTPSHTGGGGGISGWEILAVLIFCIVGIFFWWAIGKELTGSSSIDSTTLLLIAIPLACTAFSIAVLKMRTFSDILAAAAVISIGLTLVNVLLFDHPRPADYEFSDWLMLLIGMPLVQSAACALPSGLAALILSIAKKRRER